jgi:hypothetical protein
MPIVMTALKVAAVSVTIANLGGLANLPLDEQRPSLATVAEVNLCAALVIPEVVGLGREVIVDTVVEAIFPSEPSQGVLKNQLKSLKKLKKAPRKLSYQHQKKLCRKGFKTLGLGSKTKANEIDKEEL